MDWKPNNLTREAVGEFLESMVSVLPGVMGIDEVIAGCQVVNLDPYTAGLGTYPRYIQVALRDRYYQDVMYRGGLTGLAVGDYVTVVHMRDGNRYELLTAGGSTGVVVNPAPAEAHYVTTQVDPLLTNEHVAQAGEWTAVTAAAGTFQTDFHPDNPAVVTGAGVVTEYATIQDAITAANSCETVLVPPGTYSEAITLKYGVAVKGFGHRAKIIISSATDTVTTAQYGYLENVTVVANNPNAGAFAGVKVSHNGPCWLRDITIEVDQTGANVARGIATLGTNSGTLTADRIDVSVASSAAGAGAAYGVDFSLGSYELELKNFKVVVTHTGATAPDDAYGIVQAGSPTVKATEGWLDITATGAGAATDLTGTITHSEIVNTADDTRFGQKVGVGRAPVFRLDVYDAAVNLAVLYRGISSAHVITAQTNPDQDAHGLYSYISHANAAGRMDDLYGCYMYSLFTSGEGENVFGMYLYARAQAAATLTGNIRGTYVRCLTDDGADIANDQYGLEVVTTVTGDIGDDVFGIDVYLDANAAGDVTGDLFGVHVEVDNDLGVHGGTAYALYVWGRSHVDYGIYQTGGDKNYFGSDTGIGVTPPLGLLHGHDTIGGFLYWEYDGVGAAAQTIIPNGAGDVLYVLGGHYVQRASDASEFAGSIYVAPGASIDMDPGAGVLALAVAANGAVTVQRTGGALTYKVALWLLWL